MVPFITAVILLATSTAVCAGIVLPSLVLEVPGNPRSIAMGLTGTADDSDPANSWHNPANVHVEGLWFGGAFADWPGDRNRFDFNAAVGSLRRGPRGRWSFGAALRHARADLREFVGTGNVKLATHESWMTAVLSAGYGGERLRFGAGAALRWSTNEDENETTGDVGVNAGGRVNVSGRLTLHYAAAWSMRNIGMEGIIDPGGSAPAAESIEEQWVGVTVRFRLAGTDSSRAPVELGLNIDTRTDGDGDGVGTEITIMETVDLRAGYRDTIFSGEHVRTLGAGVHQWFGFFFIRLDYAWMESTGDGGLSRSLGLLFGFDF